ncbi:hypothetical protein BH10BAC3_BH10BAC3_34850 [soil metagenome]
MNHLKLMSFKSTKAANQRLLFVIVLVLGFCLNSISQTMKVYQLYFSSSYITGIKRHKPSIEFNYLLQSENLTMNVWLYNKNGKKPVKNETGGTVYSIAPLTTASINMGVYINTGDLFFGIFGISNDEFKKLKTDIGSVYKMVVLTPVVNGTEVEWKVQITQETAPPFNSLVDVPTFVEKLISKNPCPPREIAQ